MERVLIAIPSVGVSDIRFAVSLGNLAKPRGTALAAVPRSMPDIARNILFDQAVKNGFGRIFYLDDDMIVDAGLLLALSEFMDSDPSVAAVAPLAFRRHPPFQPCVGMARGDRYEPLSDLDGGPIDVDMIHFAATLVRVEALQKVPPPRFEFSASRDGSSVIGEDISLSRKLKPHGRLVCIRNLPEALHIGVPPTVGRREHDAASRASSRILIP